MKLVLPIFFAFFCSGCASAVIQHQVLQKHINMPVDCTKAEVQINALQKQRISGGGKLLNGFASIIPTSALVNLIAGEYRSRWKIANGDFNEHADNHIAKIKLECGEPGNQALTVKKDNPPNLSHGLTLTSSDTPEMMLELSNPQRPF